MAQPNVDPNFVSNFARNLWDRTRVHQDLLGQELQPLWEELPEPQRLAFQRAATEVLEDLGAWSYTNLRAHALWP